MLKYNLISNIKNFLKKKLKKNFILCFYEEKHDNFVKNTMASMCNLQESTNTNYHQIFQKLCRITVVQVTKLSMIIKRRKKIMYLSCYSKLDVMNMWIECGQCFMDRIKKSQE